MDEARRTGRDPFTGRPIDPDILRDMRRNHCNGILRFVGVIGFFAAVGIAGVVWSGGGGC